MTEDRFYRDPALVQFYDIENGWSDYTRHCLKLGQGARSVLDLGCGTGLLAAALGNGRRVVGVDPAGAMLAVARARPGGERVHWVEADARDVRLGERFGLVVLTGHAFQVFLTDGDQAAVCRTIAAHLAPGGRFIFDSRNPDCREWEEWTPDASRRSFAHPALGLVEAWNDVVLDAPSGIAEYGTFYRTDDGVLSARSRIRFASLNAIAARITEAGLKVERWLGDWQGGAFAAGSREMIAVGSLA